MESNKKKALIAQLTLEEKAGLCSGGDFWHLKGIERLGIPAIMVSDGPNGLRKQEDKADHLGINESIKAVCFPPAALFACSFDRTLMEELGDVIGKEAQATDVAVVLGPGVNIKRSPLCGRNFEYISEDPYLAGELAVPYIKGVQAHHVGTSLKHYAANNQENNRMSCSSDADERTLREIYLPAFETAVKKAQPATLMCSYNLVNGVHASENNWLMNEVLRDEWGFQGLVLSDWGATVDRVNGLAAGLDLEMPGVGDDAAIVAAVKNGTLGEAVLDKAVERVLDLIDQWTAHREQQALTLEADHDFARHVAEESIVLLKNNGVLPLEKSQKVLFVGEYAAVPRYQGGGSSHVNSFKVSDALTAVKAYADVSYAKGFSGMEDVYDPALAEEAISAAKAADRVVIFAGLPESFESEGYDRTHMDMPACQNRLIREIAQVNENVILVLHNGAPVTMPWLNDVAGVVEAYLGGQAVGEAVVNVLYGIVNPSGKLAETFPIKLSDNPSYLNFGGKESVEYREGIFVGYRYYDKKEMAVNFPFGHGLSYTTFAYSNLRLDKPVITDPGTLTVSVDVTNTGAVAGKEIVQLYIEDHTGKVQRPIRELKGFAKVSLDPGETKTVSMHLDTRSFSWYSAAIRDWYAYPGEYGIAVGSSSRDIRLTETVRLETDRALSIHITPDTTVGDLYDHPKLTEIGRDLLARTAHFFASENIQDDTLGDAIAGSVPLRAVVKFGIMSQEEYGHLVMEYSDRPL